MNNPRDWSSGLWLLVRQTAIISACLLVTVGGCAVVWTVIRGG